VVSIHCKLRVSSMFKVNLREMTYCPVITLRSTSDDAEALEGGWTDDSTLATTGSVFPSE
jgi:hypothetical protein